MYEASLQATAAQLAAIDVWPGAFVFWEAGYRKPEEALVTATLLPGMDPCGLPAPKLRVGVTYRSPSFPHFVPRKKSAHQASVVSRCRDCEGSLRAVEDFVFGNRTVRLACESLYAPYTRLGEVQPRVISLLLPPDRPPARMPTQALFERM